MSLFNEGDGCFEILSHTKIEHDTGQPPPAKRGGCDFLSKGQILFGGNQPNIVQFLQQPVCALSPEAIFLIQVSDFLCQISDVTTQLVVSDGQIKMQL